MKRLITLYIVISIIFSTFVITFASNTMLEDVVETKYDNSVEELMKLGIIEGFPDGSYGAEKPVTRAQLAKILVLSLKLEKDVESLKGQTIFSDVELEHWASGYINIAVKNKLIVGYPEGIFKPEKTVTYAEAVTMVIRALGLESEVNGVWPESHIQKARELNLLNNIETNSSADEALRGNIAILVNNTIKSPKWEIKYEDEKETTEKEEEKKPNSNGGSSKPSGGSSKPSGGSSKPSGGSSKPSGGTNKPADKPNKPDVVLPDSGDVILPDSGDVILPDSGDVILPDSGDVINPDSGDVINPDSGDVIVPDSNKLYYGIVEYLIRRAGVDIVTINGTDYEIDEENEIPFVVGQAVVYIENEDKVVCKKAFDNKAIDDNVINAKVTQVEDELITLTDDIIVNGEKITVDSSGVIVLDIDRNDVKEVFSEFKFIELEVYFDTDNKIEFFSFEEMGMGIVDVRFSKGDRIIIDETNKLFIIVTGIAVDEIVKNGELFLLNRGFYAITSDGAWRIASNDGEEYSIMLANISGDEEIYNFASNTLAKEYETNLFGSGESVFVWAEIDQYNRIQEMQKLLDKDVYGEYTVESFSAELDEDNYLNNTTKTKVTASTIIFIVESINDEEDNVVGFKTEILQGVDALNGVTSGLVAFETESEVSRAKFVFVTKKDNSNILNIGLVEKVTERRNVIYATVNGNEYIVELESNNDTPLTFENIKGYLNSYILFTVDGEIITIRKEYTTIDLNDAAIVMTVDEEFITLNGELLDLGTIIDSESESVIEKLKDYTFVRGSAYVDIDSIIVFEDDVEILGKGIENAIFKKGNRVLVDEENKFIIIIAGFDYDEILRDGKVIEIISEDFYAITSDGSWCVAGESGVKYYIVLNAGSGDEILEFATEKLGNKFAEDLYETGKISFVWAGLGTESKIEILEEIISGEKYGNYTVEEFTSEIDEDNYLNNLAKTKVTSSTRILTVFTQKDEDGNIIGYELEVSNGAKNLVGIEHGLVAYSSISQINEAEYVFLEGKAPEMRYGLVQSAMQRRDVVYAMIEGTEYEVDNLTFEEAGELVNQIVLYELEDNIITIKDAYTTKALDNSYIVIDVDDDLVTFDKAIVLRETALDKTLDILSEKVINLVKNFTFVRASAYADYDNLIVFEDGVEVLEKGIEDVIFEKGDRVIIDEKNNTIIVVSGFEYDEVLENGELVDSL